MSDRVCRNCAMRIPQSKVIGEVVAPDGDVDPDCLLPHLTDMIDLGLIKYDCKS